MPVEVTDEYIRVRVKDPGLFVEGSFRTIDISKDQGIKAVIGKLKSDPGGSTVVQVYLFDKEKWTTEEAKKWVSDHKKSKNSIERRFMTTDMRLSYDSGPPKIVGYAAVFNKPSLEFWPGFHEEVSPGAFARTIKQDDIRALWNHNRDYVLGRTKSGTLKLSEDDRGLAYEIIPPDTTWAKDLMVLIKRGDISQSSFGFDIIKEERQIEDEGKKVVRFLKEVRLFDVSPVTFPAYPQADVHVRMIQNENEQIYLFEDSEEAIVLPFVSELPDPDKRSPDPDRRSPDPSEEESFKQTMEKYESLKKKPWI